MRARFCVVALLAAAVAIPIAAAGADARAHKTQSSPFSGRGMWIWYVSKSNGGSVSSIIATARRYGVGTLMVKSGDGTSAWSQFSSSLVSALHAAGLHVCGWQYVYGSNPAGEGRVGATAAHKGADCLLIDAEAQYEGKYVEAQTYMKTLRKSVGSSFPIALASFPYVDFHPSLPYSVFMGPNGAQYNVPQMYWKDIGVSPDVVYAHTYVFNRPYGRTIAPLGQIYNAPPVNDVKRFRALSIAYGATGVSWWDWQEASPGTWKAISQRVGAPSGFKPDPQYATLRQGAKGDLVVWAQQHLYSAGQHVTIDGNFGASTKRAVRSFQSSHGLTVDGAVGSATWKALLRYAPKAVVWTSSGAHVAHAAGDGGLVAPVPRSAALPAKRYEIPRGIGQG